MHLGQLYQGFSVLNLTFHQTVQLKSALALSMRRTVFMSNILIPLVKHFQWTCDLDLDTVMQYDPALGMGLTNILFCVLAFFLL